MPVSKSKRRSGNKTKSQIKKREKGELQRLSAVHGMPFKSLNEARIIIRQAKQAKHPRDLYESIVSGFEEMVDHQLSPIVEMGKTETEEEINAFIKDFGEDLYEDVKAANAIIDNTRRGFEEVGKTLPSKDEVVDDVDHTGLWMGTHSAVSNIIEINDEFQLAMVEFLPLIKRLLNLINEHSKELVEFQETN